MVQFRHPHKAGSSLYHMKMGERGREMFTFDKGRVFPVQVEVILGLGCAVYDVKVNHRLQFGNASRHCIAVQSPL